MHRSRGRLSIREEAMNEFNKGNLPIILLNSKETGAGVNLQGGTDCIIFGRIVEVEQQCIGRLWRLGQTKTVNIHRLYL